MIKIKKFVGLRGVSILEKILEKRRIIQNTDTSVVSKILKDIKKNKNKALIKYEKRFSKNNRIKPSTKEINNAIKSAGTAPNGANLQPWHFVVIKNKKIKKEIRKAAEKEEKKFYNKVAPIEWLKALEPLGTDENKKFLEEAPILIAVFACVKFDL